MKDTPLAISQLSLKNSFKGYATPVAECIEVFSDALLYAYEPDDLKYSVCSKNIPIELLFDNRYFTIINKSNKDIVFWAIDGKFLKSGNRQRCDCAIFDENVLCFVEFKTRSEGTTIESREEIIQHAQNQIISTCKFIEDQIKTQKNINLRDKVDLEGHICLSKRFPRKTSEEMNIQALFAKENKFGLYFDGIKEF